MKLEITIEGNGLLYHTNDPDNTKSKGEVVILADKISCKSSVKGEIKVVECDALEKLNKEHIKGNADGGFVVGFHINKPLAMDFFIDGIVDADDVSILKIPVGINEAYKEAIETPMYCVNFVYDNKNSKFVFAQNNRKVALSIMDWYGPKLWGKEVYDYMKLLYPILNGRSKKS